MKITEIKIRKIFEDSGPLRAIGSVTLDDQLVIHDLKVIYAKERYFVVMPGRKNADGSYRDVVHPVNAEFRGYLESKLIDAYDRARSESGNPESGAV